MRPLFARAVAAFPWLGLGALSSAALAETSPLPAMVARTTEIPACTMFVDAAATSTETGTREAPFQSISTAVSSAQSGAVICVAEGLYREKIEAGDKAFTLAGGFKSGSGFATRDSAKHVSKAQGDGTGSFFKIAGDTAPAGDALSAVDGFEITGYSQAILRDYWESQRFDITNNFIHDNTCERNDLNGAAFALMNTSGTIKGNVIRKNACGRGGGGTLVDSINKGTVLVANNHVDGNSGVEPDSAHGGGFYFFVNKLTVTGNLFTGNSVSKWGGGLYIGAYTAGGQFTNATMRWNIYRGNKAGDSGGGFFCDDGAICSAEHELYVSNCGGNILVDGGAGGSEPTRARFDHITTVSALTPNCDQPGMGFYINSYEALAPDSYEISNALFWANGDGEDLVGACDKYCDKLKVAIDYSMLKVKPDQSVKIAYGGNIVPPGDPMFVAPETGDYHLKTGSPARGKGTGGSDLGAYTAIATTSEPMPTPDTAPPNEEAASPASSAETPPEAAETSPRIAQAAPAADEAKIKAAYDEAKALGTIAAWRAFLATFPDGFYADMAGAHLRSLGYEPGSGAPSPLGPAKAPAAPSQQASPPPSPAPAAAPAPAPASQPARPQLAPQATSAQRFAPAVKRGARFFGFPEQFNRYYTDPDWKPARTVFVSPQGGGDGATRNTPATLPEAVTAAKPGTMIIALRGTYKGGIDFEKEMSGTYDAPIVLFGERNSDGSVAAIVDCNVGNRKACFNFEGANYIAVDGFELKGGVYGYRAVGLGFPAREHSRGIAMLNSFGHDQDRDPFKTAQSDWTVIEGNLGTNAKSGDGHGIYVSGGSDWGIIRRNQTHSNASSDLQINADPASTCKDAGIEYNDPRCDALAGQGEGGQGASDYFLVEGNYSHHSAVGPNFTSLRRSMVRNNVFGPQTRHNATFWQETDNPKLGSIENRVFNNLFITTGKHAIKFENNSGRNLFSNNVVLGVTIAGGTISANPKALLMETDATSADNVASGNAYVSGSFEGRKPSEKDILISDFKPEWFKSFPTTADAAVGGFTPTSSAPLLDKARRSLDVPIDFTGVARGDPTELGPFEAR